VGQLALARLLSVTRLRKFLKEIKFHILLWILIKFDVPTLDLKMILGDPWGNRLGLENLGAIWRNCSQSGALNLVVSYVIEDETFIEQLLKTIPEADVCTIQLSADKATLATRLKGRATIELALKVGML